MAVACLESGPMVDLDRSSVGPLDPRVDDPPRSGGDDRRAGEGCKVCAFMERGAAGERVGAVPKARGYSTGLSFAVPGHPEYLRISKAEALLVDASLTREREAAAE